MKAGRELDALVAEKVMGQRLSGGRDFIMDPEEKVTGFKIPPYSTDMAAAWGVVELLISTDGPYRAQKWSFGMEYSTVIDWVVDFTPRRNHPLSREYPAYQVTSVNPATAICLAALKAVGVDTDAAE